LESARFSAIRVTQYALAAGKKERESGFMNRETTLPLFTDLLTTDH
jgi:hypothetical protein